MNPVARHVVVTGAAGGIGRALVAAFGRAGFEVIGTDLQPRPADLSCRLWIQVDIARTVREPDLAEQVLGQIREALPEGGGLRALVNNAAVQRLGDTKQASRTDWHDTLDANVLAPFFWTQGLLLELQRGRGSVVNISSIHARLTKPGFVAYATSKAALSGLTRAMAVDLGGRVRVNAIEPAAIATPMLKAGFATAPDRYAGLEACHPIGRIGEPDEVAAAAVWLASDEAAFMHGACLRLDGAIGATLHDPA
jgi:NAD(P)-dependent dehydrogenase (short-subunit alcohol dehydrogenase family)